MLAAIPLFGSRVSPRCLFSETMIVARVTDGAIASQRTASIKGLSEDTLLDELAELGVDTLVCGGADQAFVENAGMCGIKVINNVAGEVTKVLEAMVEGRLVSGFGLDKGKDDPNSCPPASQAIKIHCLRCSEKSCLQGKPCSMGPLNEKRVSDPVKLHIAEIAADVSAEDDRKLCRVAELVHFALGMGYQRVGVAFCVEMFREAEILCEVLQRFFEVVPICCRIGSSPDEAQPAGASCCNVLGQAESLNRMATDINVMVGLCVGCDILFAGYSKAPSTTLFVKDRSLANNPVGALYSSHYLEEIVAGPGHTNPQGGIS